MNKKRVLLSMALAGACFQTGSLFAQYPDSRSYLRASSVGRVGDGASGIGDSASSRPVAQDVRPIEFRNNTVDASIPSEPLPADPIPSYSRPVSTASSSSYLGDTVGSGESCGCGTNCGGSCGQAFEMSCVAPSICNSGWVEGGALLWWSGSRQTPPLVTRNPNIGQTPLLATSEVLAGGTQNVGGNMLPGFYAGFGKWLDAEQCLGIGGRVTGLFGDSQNNTYTFDGNRAIGVPYFDVSQGLPSAQVVAINGGNAGSNTGSITVASDLDFLMTEAFLRKAVAKSGTTRMDLTGGYMFARLDDSLILGTRQVNGLLGDGIDNGTVLTSVDQFTGSNTFHGGQLGLLAQTARGKWSISSGTRFGLGNMKQRVSVSGLYDEVPPPNSPNQPIHETRGLFVQSSNAGVQNRNVFAFVPQIDLKLGYQARSNLRFDVGYSFLYFSDVALAGKQIDTNVDINNIFAAPNSPVQKFENSSLILHGLTLGGTYSF